MNLQHIMVIIDPTSETDQPCLRRAENLARHYPNARFTLFLCDYIPALDGGLLFNNELLSDARNKLLGHREQYLDKLATGLRSQGHTVNTMAVWASASSGTSSRRSMSSSRMWYSRPVSTIVCSSG